MRLNKKRQTLRTHRTICPFILLLPTSKQCCNSHYNQADHTACSQHIHQASGETAASAVPTSPAASWRRHRSSRASRSHRTSRASGSSHSPSGASSRAASRTSTSWSWHNISSFLFSDPQTITRHILQHSLTCIAASYFVIVSSDIPHLMQIAPDQLLQITDISFVVSLQISPG